MDWIYFGLFFIALFALIGAAEGIRAALKWSPEATRKMVHIITGLLVSTTPFIFQSKTPLIVISLIFIVFNFLAVQFGLMKGMHGTERRTYGTVFYPIAFLLLVILCWDHYKLVLIVSMLIMALADALAAMVGETVAHPHEYVLAGEKKSLEGSTTMLLASAIITFLYLVFGGRFYGCELSLAEALWMAVLVGIIAAACEAVSFQGSDNLSVPLGSAFILHFLLSHSLESNEWFTLGFVLALVIAYVSFKVGFLDAGGATVTFLLGVVIFGIGRWRFSLPILTFFI
ncbi:MAG: hypothetical protein ONB05_10830, partial [candidate division KSB1 bacterium]|nr:hypothetical protein [candidate division KSB1 bacterium]